MNKFDRLIEIAEKQPSDWLKKAKFRQRWRLFFKIKNKIHLKYLRIKRYLKSKL